MAYNLYKPVITLEGIIILRAFGDSIYFQFMLLCYIEGIHSWLRAGGISIYTAAM